MKNHKIGGWMPIAAYRDFYDVPRAFLVVPRQGLILFFDCSFDNSIDEYPGCYQVFALEGLDLAELPTDWRLLSHLSKERLGEVPIASLKFDNTRRKEVLVDDVEKLIRTLDRTPSVNA